MDLYQITLAAEQEKEIDYMVDQKLQDIGKTKQEVVIDSRMAWHWMPFSFKVFLDLDLDTAARRIIQSMDPVRLEHEHIPNDAKEYANMLQQRLDSEARRYKKLYDVNPYDKSNYDLVVDTELNSPDQVIEKIVSAYHEWLSSGPRKA